MKKYKQQNTNFPSIINFFNGATKKFYKAKKILTLDEETAYQMFYEAMLKASLALMLSYGLRPRSLPGHHQNIIGFCGKKLGQEFKDIVNSFDKMRRKRNQAIYQPIAIITETEAKNSLKTAEEYLLVIKEHLNDNNPQLNLKF